MEAKDFLWGRDKIQGAQNLVVVPYIGTPAGGGYAAKFSSPDIRASMFELIWGTTTPNTSAPAQNSAAHYFLQVSRSGLVFTDVNQVYVTRTIPTIARESTGLVMRKDLLVSMAPEVDFGAYRPQGRQLLRRDVMVAMVAAGKASAGTVRATKPAIVPIPGQLPVELEVAAYAENAALATIVHELMHLMVAENTDLYGLEPSGEGAWNTPSSVMGSPNLVHPDAMHKILMGWVKPRLIDVSSRPRRTERLLAQTVNERNSRDHTGDPVLLFDQRRGNTEFFVLEFRTGSARQATPGNYESLKDAGLAIWRMNSDGKVLVRKNGYIINLEYPRERPVGDDRLNGRSWTRFVPARSAGTGVLYGRKADGSLVWYRHSSWADPTSGFASWSRGGRETPIGKHRRWDDYLDLLAGGNGAIYGITRSGQLAWFRHLGADTGADTWVRDGKEEIVSTGNGWADFKQLVSGGDGVFYGIKSDGSLVWYRHEGHRDGGRKWTDNRERQIGGFRDWGRDDRLIAAGSGVLYAVKGDGTLAWFRHEGWQDGSDDWRLIRETIVGSGNGWDGFHDILAAGDGVLYCIKRDGSLVWYRHTGWRDGAPSWTSHAERVLSKGQGITAGDRGGAYIDWGPSGRLDTPKKRSERYVLAPPINLVAPPDGAVGHADGFWTNDHGPIRLRWSDGRPLDVSVRVAQFADDASFIDIEIEPV